MLYPLKNSSLDITKQNRLDVIAFLSILKSDYIRTKKNPLPFMRWNEKNLVHDINLIESYIYKN